MKKNLTKQYYNFLKLKNRIFQGRPVLVLMYHRISNVSDKKLAHLTVSVTNFEKQLVYFKEKYQILKLSDDWTCLKKTGLVITFDDGYADNIINALPLLEKYQIPATIFVTTLNTNTIKEFWWDRLVYDYSNVEEFFCFPSLKDKVFKEQYTYKYIVECVSKLDNDQKEIWFLEFEKSNKIFFQNREEYRPLTNLELKQLSEHPLIDIGIHSHNHYSLGNLTYEEQKNELSISVEKLNELTTKNIKYLALPHGSYNGDTLKAIEDIGILGVLYANNYYSNFNNKSSGKINRILIPSISNEELVRYMKHYDF